MQGKYVVAHAPSTGNVHTARPQRRRRRACRVPAVPAAHPLCAHIQRLLRSEGPLAWARLCVLSGPCLPAEASSADR